MAQRTRNFNGLTGNRFADRLLEDLGDVGGGAVSSSAIASAILLGGTLAPVLATDALPLVRGGVLGRATATALRDYVLGISLGTANIPENLTVTQVLTVNGNTVLGNATSDTITATARFASVLTPSTANARDLGDTSLPWRTGYFGTSLGVGFTGAISSGFAVDVLGKFGVRPSSTTAYPSGFANGIAASFHTMQDASPVFGWALTRVGAHTSAPSIEFYKTRSTTGAPTAVANGDSVGTFGFEAASDGTTIRRAAAITAVVNGTVSAGTVPVDIVVQVSPSADAFGLTGAVWRWQSDGIYRPETHNVTDLATTAIRIRTGYFGTSVIAPTGTFTNVGGTLSTAAQPNVTSLGTLTALQVDNLNLNGNTLSSTSGGIAITPLAGQVILLDGTISVDAGVVTGATSITSTAFIGALTGNASTATALQTVRTLWGQNFDGTANVTGSLTSVGDITGTGAVTLTATAATLALVATSTNVITGTVNSVEGLRVAQFTTASATTETGLWNVNGPMLGQMPLDTDATLLAAGVGALFNVQAVILRAGVPSAVRIGRVNGSLQSPTQVTSGQSVGAFNFAGYTNASTLVTIAQVLGVARESLTATAQGSFVRVNVIDTGTTTLKSALVIRGGGTNIGELVSEQNTLRIIPGPTAFVIRDAANSLDAATFNAAGTNLTLAGSINTGAPTGGSGAWELGIANAVSPTAPDRTVTIEIGGTAYYLHAKTTND